MLDRFPHGATRMVGGLGDKLDSVGVLKPIFRSGDRMFFGTHQPHEVLVTEELPEDRFQRLISSGQAVRLRRDISVRHEDRKLICLTKDVAKQLAHVHCLKSTLTLEATVEPVGRALIPVPNAELQPLLTQFGEGLLTSAESELALAISEQRTEHARAAEAYAYTAAFRCFSGTDKPHRHRAYVLIIASLLQRTEKRRINAFLLVARNDLRENVDVELRAEAAALLARLRQPNARRAEG